MFNNFSDSKGNNYDDNKKDFIQLYNKAILLWFFLDLFD